MPHAKPDREEQLRILRRLNAAEAFETFLQTKYIGQKRFSLEGGETLIPLLDAVLSAAAEAALDEVVIGMAHRGRLNVLANIVGKPYAQIFGEFEGNLDPRSAHGDGDVKYHLGADGQFTARDGGKITHLSLAANPATSRRSTRWSRAWSAPSRTCSTRRGRLHRPAHAHPRRRGLRGPGHRGRDAEPVAAARLPHRRHGPHRGQQPGRLHHRARRARVQRVRHRRGPDDPGADLPRQRRGPRGGASASAGWPSTFARRSARTS